MKKIIILLMLVFSATTFAANFEMDKVSLKCTDLEFTLNLSTNTATFQNIRHFGIGEMIANEPIGFTWNRESTVRVEYNWYYTTVIDIRFVNKMYELDAGKTINVFVSFDDGDGISAENEKLSCTVL